MRNVHYFWRHPLAEQVRGEGREEGLEVGREVGRAAGWAEAILRTLQRRQIDVPDPDPVRDRILASTDIDELGTWLDRSHEVADAQELFTEGS